LEGNQGDAMTHLLMVHLIRENGGRIPRQTPQLALNCPNDYPMFFHKLHAWLPRHVLERREWLISPLYEAVHFSLLFIATTYMLDTILHWPFSRGTAFLIILAVAMTPLLDHQPGRFAAFGERTFGFLTANGYFVCMLLYAGTGQWLWALGAVLFLTLTSVSSKFGTQAIAFITCALAIVRADPLPIVLFLSAFGVSIILSFGYSVKVLRGLIRHSSVYRSWFMYVQDYVKGISIWNVWKAIRLASRGHLREALRTAQQHPLGKLPWLVPWLFLFFPLLFSCTSWCPTDPQASGLLSSLMDLALACWLVSGLVMLDPFKFLGEAERYLEYGLFPMVTVVTLGVLSKDEIWWALYALTFVICLISFLRQNSRDRAPRGDKQLTEVVHFLRSVPSTRFIGIPGRLAFPICYGTAHAALWVLANVPAGPLLQRFMKLFGPQGEATYPFVHPSVLGDIRSALGVDLIVVWKAALAGIKQAFGLEYDFSGMAILFENQSYVVFKASPQQRPV
jgi:hypothetical protein